MSDATAEKPQLFLRNATGLVRAMSAWDAFAIDLTQSSPWANVVILLPLGLVLFAGANLWLSVVTGGILGLSVVFVYTSLSQAMPRSGGDYVFISRTFSPFLGFLGSWVMMFLTAFFAGFNAYSLGAWILPDFFGTFGAMTNDGHLISLATSVARPVVVDIIMVVSIILWFLIMYRSVKLAARVQMIALFFFLGAVLVGLPTLLLTSRSTYLVHFNTFAAHFHTSAAGLESIAAKGGALLHPAFSLGSTIAFWPFVMYVFGYSINSVMMGGEIRNPRRSQYIAVTAATVLALTCLGGFFAIDIFKIPKALMTAMAYFTYINPSSSPVPFPLYAQVPMSLASTNPLLLVFISGACFFGLWMASLGLYFWGTRYMFAWAMDGVAPSQVAHVTEKRNSPAVALVVMTVLTLMFGLMLEYVPNFTLVVGSLPQAVLIALTATAAIVFPFRMKHLYRASIKREVLGIPLIVIAGVIALAMMGVMVYYFITDSVFGAVTGASLQFIYSVVGAGIVFYGVARLLARRRGVNLALTYKEIPPE